MSILLLTYEKKIAIAVIVRNYLAMNIEYRVPMARNYGVKFYFIKSKYKGIN